MPVKSLSAMDLELNGEMVWVRPLRNSDAESLYEHVQDEAVARWTLWIPHPYPKEDALKFIRKTRRDIRHGKSYTFGILQTETAGVIGAVSLMNINRHNQSAELGYWLGRRFWGRGYMTEAILLALRFGFERIKLHRVEAEVFEQNAASASVLQKAGFTHEGTARQANHKRGHWHNMHRFGILHSEF